MTLLALVSPSLAADFLQGDAAGPGMHAQVNILREGGGFTNATLVTTSCADIVVGATSVLDRAADPASPIAGSVLSTVFFVGDGAAEADCTVYLDGVALDALSAGIDNLFHIVTPAAAPVDGGTHDMDGTADGLLTLSSSLRTDGGTLVLSGLDVPLGTVLMFDTTDPNTATAGNESYLPVILLVDGAATIDGTVDLSGADGEYAPYYQASDGGNGGPGGGGGGVGSNCISSPTWLPGDGFTGGGGTPTHTCIEYSDGGIGAVEGPDGDDGGEGVFTDIQNSAIGYAGGVGGGTGVPWGTGGGGGYCCGTAGAGGYGGGGGNGHSDASGWGGGGGGFGTDGENGIGTLSGAKKDYQVGGAGLANGDDSLVPLAGGSGGAGGDSGSGSADGAGGGGGGGALLLFAESLAVGASARFELFGGEGGSTYGTNPGSSTGGAGGSGGGLHLAAWSLSGLDKDSVDLTGGSGGHEYYGYYSGDGGEGRMRLDGTGPLTLDAGPTGAAATTFEGPAFVSVADTDITIASSGSVSLWIYDETGAYVSSLALAEDGSATLYPYLAEGTNYLTLVDDDTGVLGPAGATSITYDPDADDDGFHAPRYGGDDCDDTDADVNPDAIEVCNGIDDDCDGDVDPDGSADADTWYADADEDGYGDDDTSLTACDSSDGYVAMGGDCDDTSTMYHPGADESDCTDPSDYNCDGTVLYADDDADGWAACEDCDDNAAAAWPGGTEVCDGLDNDCDGETDPVTSTDALTWYADADADDYGDASVSTSACAAPDGYVADATDCDDTSDMYHPGATEADCTDPNDYNCDGSVGYSDADSDGWAACAECDDASADVNPDALEVCNERDDNCDGSIDEGVTTTFHADADGDGYGAAEVEACEVEDGIVVDGTDCDDTAAGTYPGAVDIPDDGIDQDCDGVDAHEEPDTGDTGVTDTGVTDTGDTGDTDTAVTDTADTEPSDDAGASEEEKYQGGGGCGCASGSTGAGAVTGLLALGAVARRRRGRHSPMDRTTLFRMSAT